MLVNKGNNPLIWSRPIRTQSKGTELQKLLIVARHCRNPIAKKCNENNSSQAAKATQKQL